MSLGPENVSFDSSASTVPYNDSEHADSTIKFLIKNVLKSRIFLGRYVERRLVDKRVLYRDIVLVSAAEVELNRDLLEARKKLKAFYPSSYWIGITSTELLDFAISGTCIWTEIENEPFGAFWFQIKTVLFQNNEVMLKLKCVRHISESFLELEPLLVGSGKSKSSNVNENITSPDETFIITLRNALTISNLKEFITFLFAFVIAIFTGTTSLINFLGNFILALLRESSYFINNSTPLLLGFLDFISKIVGGLYILIAMIFKQNPTVPTRNTRHRNYRPINYDTSYDNHFD